MPPQFRALKADAFVREVRNFGWTRDVWRVDLHHTWFPAHADYRGVDSLEGMRRFHVHNRGFEDIAQHVTIAPDGLIWTGRDWNRTPASIGCGMNVGAFMIEMVGNFDRGFDRLQGAQLESTLVVIDEVQRHFHLPVYSLLFHREVPQTDKTCPGSGIEKLDMLRHLTARRARRRPSAGSDPMAAVA